MAFGENLPGVTGVFLAVAAVIGMSLATVTPLLEGEEEGGLLLALLVVVPATAEAAAASPACCCRKCCLNAASTLELKTHLRHW